MNEALKQIQQFHGHLGPYVVLGYKMGEIATQHLGSDPFSKQADVWASTKPPISCIIDGIQISSGCTLGKGNIMIHADTITRARFTHNNGNHVEIRVKPSIKQEIDTTVTEDNITRFSEQLYQRHNQELFEIL
jgi:formylmethanofuran dehydrogenase subunit E